jgi:anti-sigma regulatory factor (Ser/Thr protein kinase)
MTPTATFKVAGVPDAVAEARAAVTRAAADQIAGGILDTTCLLVSELVTNGILHGAPGEPIEISLTCESSGLRVEVKNRGKGFVPNPGATAPDEGGGFGLYLVERLADRWGVSRDGCTRVWFELENPSVDEPVAPQRARRFSADAVLPNRPAQRAESLSR